MENTFSVIIIGGSYSGLSAAMSLGRSLQQTLIIDSGKPCNRQTPHSHNFLTQDGKTPQEIATIGKNQVLAYKTISFHHGKAIKGKKRANDFEIETEAGLKFYAKKLIFATGINDQMPVINGFSDCWGKSVIHCPYCHGYEFHGVPTGIMANGAAAMHYAKLIKNLTDTITIFTNGSAEFTEDEVEKLEMHKIKIVESKITAIDHTGGILKQILLADGNKVSLKALYAKVPFVQHSSIPESLGCEITDDGFIKVDAFQKTTLENVFACGDNSSMMRSVANAVSTGSLTGAMVNMELVGEVF